METWYAAASPVELGMGPTGAVPIVVVADVGTGNVQVQFKDQGGSWFTPTSEEYTLTADDVYVLERSNCPPVRILATGNAQFQVWGVYPDTFEASS
ncbi:hypothetical protein [Pseudooceanicola sp.]|uniref:hypothetical protein n=1 Tax=Pseudooceanicola sp. TaxID=1914328 RepID=UPI0035197A9F